MSDLVVLNSRVVIIVFSDGNLCFFLNMPCCFGCTIFGQAHGWSPNYYALLYSCVLYLLLHIDFLYSLLEFLNGNLDQLSNSKSLSDIQCFDVLNFVTYIHRKLWKSKVAVENRFGWIILVVLLKFFIDIMNCFFGFSGIIILTKDS